MKITRRAFLRGGLGVVGAGALTGLYTWQVEPRWVQLARRRLPIRHLPTGLAGRTLAQISDLHIGDRYDWRYQVGALRELAALAPDFVVYTGDFVSYESAAQLAQLETLLRHAVRGRLGTAAVLGNHDYGHGWAQSGVAEEIGAMLSTAGIPTLRNEAGRFEGLQIVGIDDFGPQISSPTFLQRSILQRPR